MVGTKRPCDYLTTIMSNIRVRFLHANDYSHCLLHARVG